MSNGTGEGQGALGFLADYRRRADARLDEVLLVRERRLQGLPFDTASYFAHAREYALRGGKRLRGALVELGHAAVRGDRSPAEVLDASLAFELVHAYFLAYDDVMDRDELRRGGKALHVLATETARAHGAADAAHRGLSVTLLLGNLLEAAAFELLAGACAGSANARDVLGFFHRVVEDVNVGQLLDVCAVDATGATLSDVSAIHRLKTGLYTTEGPLMLGALLAGVGTDSPQMQALLGYARPLGEAFQLVDDLLGVVGEAETTGKGSASDLREGKRSAVVEEALVRGDAERLKPLVGRPLDEAEAEEARALVIASGAPQVVRERARQLADEAVQALRGASLEPQAVGLLDDVARLVVERQN